MSAGGCDYLGAAVAAVTGGVHGCQGSARAFVHCVVGFRCIYRDASCIVG